MSVISDRNLIRAYAALWILAYLAVYFFFRDYLPDEYFRDSQLIQKLAISHEEAGGAYEMAALVTRLVPQTVLTMLVAIMGSGMIWMVISSLRTTRGMVLVIPVLAPFLVLNVMAFGKEVFVLPFTYLILWWTMRSRSTFNTFAFIAVVYVLYGIFFRQYYFIILLMFLGCITFRKISAPLRVSSVLLVITAIFFVPSHVFGDIQGDRDQINFVANKLFVVVHTAIYNPLPPDNPFNFIVNYLYAAVRLTFPFLFRREVSDWILFFNVVFYGQLLYVGLKKRWDGPLVMMPLLFIAHVLVLFIFEPDLGSYLRHASSIILYLLPSLRLLEQQRVDNFRRGERKKDDVPSTLPA